MESTRSLTSFSRVSSDSTVSSSKSTSECRTRSQSSIALRSLGSIFGMSYVEREESQRLRGIAQPSKGLLDRQPRRLDVQVHVGPRGLRRYMPQCLTDDGGASPGVCKARTERPAYVVEGDLFLYVRRLKERSPRFFRIHNMPDSGLGRRPNPG